MAASRRRRNDEPCNDRAGRRLRPGHGAGGGGGCGGGGFSRGSAPKSINRPGSNGGFNNNRPGGNGGFNNDRPGNGNGNCPGNNRPGGNNNINISTNVNVVGNNRRGGYHGGGGCCYNNGYDVWDAIGTAAAVTATVAVTSAIIGSITTTRPPDCVQTNYGNATYLQCGSSWYQPSMVGSNVQYVVVSRPN